MIRRERVNSPDELRPGDRVDLAWQPSGFTTMDVLYRSGPERLWHGIVLTAPADAQGVFSDGGRTPIAPGMAVKIAASSYSKGAVFVRRRSREDLQVARCREVRGG